MSVALRSHPLLSRSRASRVFDGLKHRQGVDWLELAKPQMPSFESLRAVARRSELQARGLFPSSLDVLIAYLGSKATHQGMA
jgi:hypothetical protein